MLYKDLARYPGPERAASCWRIPVRYASWAGGGGNVRNRAFISTTKHSGYLLTPSDMLFEPFTQ